MFGVKKDRKCSVCGNDIPSKCGLKYRMKVRRYTPDGWHCEMPKKGVVCEGCLNKLRKMILEYGEAKAS